MSARRKKGGLKIDYNWDAIPMPDRRQRECGEKELLTETDARTRAQLWTSRGTPMNAYKCSFCRYWHVGKSN